MLSIRGWVQGDELAERIVAFVEQALAPRFNAVHRGGFAMRLVAIRSERAADRFDVVFVEFAQLLGQELGLTFSRDMRRHRLGAQYLAAYVVDQWYARKFGAAKRDQCLGQLEDVERVPTQLAATGFKRFVVQIGVLHGDGAQRLDAVIPA